VGVIIQQFTKMLGLIIFNVTLLKIPLYIFEEEKLSMFCEMHPNEDLKNKCLLLSCSYSLSSVYYYIICILLCTSLDWLSVDNKGSSVTRHRITTLNNGNSKDKYSCSSGCFASCLIKMNIIRKILI
jgi:hypothetical protein